MRPLSGTVGMTSIWPEPDPKPDLEPSIPTGKYVGSRPIKLRKSMWKDRNLDVVRKKQKEKKKLGLR